MDEIPASDEGHADLSSNRHLRAVQLLLGYAKFESAVSYLGIEVDDALAIAEQVEVRSRGRAETFCLLKTGRVVPEKTLSPNSRAVVQWLGVFATADIAWNGRIFRTEVIKPEIRL